MIMTGISVLTKSPEKIIQTEGLPIHAYSIPDDGNIDKETVESFGEEWLKFNTFSAQDLKKIGDDYFDVLPAELALNKATVLDMGCGTGRWASYLAPRVKFIECIDPSDAVFAAASLLKAYPNVRLTKTDVDNLPFEDNSFDLVYSLGVLHHIPDTAAAMKKCVQKVKRGGYFLVYLYYSLDNRGPLFKTLFHITNVVRKGISKLPAGLKKGVCSAIACTVYYPLAKGSYVLRKAGAEKLARMIPLSWYSDKSFWIMQNDALDRFGTPLEQRFSKQEIEAMMKRCGLTDIVFSSKEPYWHAIGKKI